MRYIFGARPINVKFGFTVHKGHLFASWYHTTTKKTTIWSTANVSKPSATPANAFPPPDGGDQSVLDGNGQTRAPLLKCKIAWLRLTTLTTFTSMVKEVALKLPIALSKFRKRKNPHWPTYSLSRAKNVSHSTI